VTIVLGAAVSILPVLVFLGLLVLIDSYKLVSLRAVLLSVLAGVLAAVLGYAINVTLRPALGLDFSHYSRYVAPVVEETLKAAFVIYLLQQHKVGFVVDAAIHGFAIGAGFALLENLIYLSLNPGAPPWTWVVRGFGTAIMHGGTTAILAMVSRTLLNRTAGFRLRLLVPGLFLAAVLHSLYNHFLLNPILATAVIVLVFPLVSVVVFQQSERAARAWVGEGFDSDQELLKAVNEGRVSGTPVGKYIATLREHFAPEVIVDMLCLLRLRAELAIRVKGILLMREAGFEPPPDATVKDKLRELRYLERSIGKTGLVALHPFLHTSTRDLWQLTVLEG
jgi:protease PrsW